MTKRLRVEERVAQGAEHVALVQVNVLCGEVGFTIAAGQKVNLDARVSGDARLRDVVREDWFKQVEAPVAAPVEE